MWFKRGLSFGVALCAAVSIGASAFARTKEVLPNFQCMSLSNAWNGQGAMPPPVQEFAGPGANAAPVGIAMSTIVTDRPMKIQNGRVRVVRPNGSTAWISKSAIGPWHVASNPNARCWVIRKASGLILTDSR
ncbi:hypothetical protein Acid7E03_39390 [Acidisoma sp. 7E03]